MKKFIYKILNEDEGKTVYEFLKEKGVSENFVKSLRKCIDNISINDNPSKTNDILHAGSTLKISCDAKQNKNQTNITPTSCVVSIITPLDIVYEDEFMLIVNKPAGLSCMPTRSHFNGNLGKQILEYLSFSQTNPVLRIPFRLDLDTAGIVVAFKNQLAFSLFKNANFNKTYHAIVEGKVDKQLTINEPIETIVSPDGINQQKRIVSKNGKNAITYILPLLFNENNSLVEAKIVTGRTHQIRVHLSFINHSLIGDKLYGKASNFMSFAALICKKITFFHPIKNEQINIEVEYPKSIKNFVMTKMKNLIEK